MERILRVKLYGQSFQIHKLKMDSSLIQRFQNVANEFNEPLQDAILNINFFNKLNIDNIRTINDLIDTTFKGLINNGKSQIEIYLGRKRIAKFNLSELFELTTLFSLYSTQRNTITFENLSTGLYVEEKEIGLIGAHEISVENFHIESLKFYLTNVKVSNIDYELLNFITYNNQVLPNVKSDAILTYQNCKFIKRLG